MPQIAVCRECGEEFVNRFELGKHYKAHPEHKLPFGKRSDKAKEVIKAMKSKRLEASVVPDKSKREYHRKPVSASQPLPHISFCPHCGLNLDVIAQAIQIAKEQGL